MSRLAVFFAMLVLLTAPVSAIDLVDLDEDTKLDTEDVVSDFEEGDPVTVEIPRYQLTIRVSDDKEGLDVSSPFHSDWANVWVQIEYEEDIARTFRVYFPREYWIPAPKKNLESVTSDETADLLPVQNREYTSLTVKFEESGTATFPVSSTAGHVFSGRDKAKSVVEKEFNVTIPSVSGEARTWSYVEPERLSGDNATVVLPINGTATIQYRDGDSWLVVPDCQDEATKICRFTKRGNGSIRLLSLQEQASLVRYKEGRDLSARVNAAIDDLMGIPDRIGSIVDGVLEGLLS